MKTISTLIKYFSTSGKKNPGLSPVAMELLQNMGPDAIESNLNVSNIEEGLKKFSDIASKGIKQKNPLTSDTGSSISKASLARNILINEELRLLGAKENKIEEERGLVKQFFLAKSFILGANCETQQDKMSVFFTSSTTQANKIAIGPVVDIKNEYGEIALASSHSHIFNFELGQPAESIIPRDVGTGKLDVEDIESSINYWEKLGKKVKLIHLDQPTKGDFFYSPEELRRITSFAHEKNIAVSADLERFVNNRLGYTYPQMRDVGLDIATFGMQKNGGHRSSVCVVLDNKFIKNFSDLDRRVTSYMKKLGGISDNKVILTSWGEMLSNQEHLISAWQANRKAGQIAYTLAQFDFDGISGSKLMQHYPPSTNMIFIKLPISFVKTFNNLTQSNEDEYFKLNTDRNGVTRIVTAYNLEESNLENFINYLKAAYLIYSGKEENVKIDDSQDVNLISKVEASEVIRSYLEKIQENLEENLDHKQLEDKFTLGCVPQDVSVVSEMALEYSTKRYHPPYGDDEITKNSKDAIRELLGLESNAPIAITSAKGQSINVINKFLGTTSNSVALVEPGSYERHTKFARSVKAIELPGKYKQEDKLSPVLIDKLVSFHNSSAGKHVPWIGSVILSQPTSNGHHYNQQEIAAISLVCKKHKMPLVLELDGFSYHLAKSKETYEDYIKCGVDIATLSFQGLGGPHGSAIVVVNSENLPYNSTSHQEIQIILDRTVKEHGGKTSDGSTLSAGFTPFIEMDIWRYNAARANEAKSKIKEFLLGQKISNQEIEFENLESVSNSIRIKLSEEFITILNKAGKFCFKANSKGYMEIKCYYHLETYDLEKFFKCFENTIEEYEKKTDKKTPSNMISPTNCDLLSSLQKQGRQQ